ncbi:unnamed protein product [Litomosoides sigmodontis]|uniref:Uncharacterized protein n=1 Tax=Litomosoides sigmodontis TaxID=42156 RepID=A0A3P6T684_LITSI|nr:unnamed protein product [Litomosoides sigmodontis]
MRVQPDRAVVKSSRPASRIDPKICGLQDFHLERINAVSCRLVVVHVMARVHYFWVASASDRAIPVIKVKRNSGHCF